MSISDISEDGAGNAIRRSGAWEKGCTGFAGKKYRRDHTHILTKIFRRQKHIIIRAGNPTPIPGSRKTVLVQNNSVFSFAELGEEDARKEEENNAGKPIAGSKVRKFNYCHF